MHKTLGDSVCDLAIAWTFLDNESREIFKNHRMLDDQTWERAKGWALWKAMLMVNGNSEPKHTERSAKGVINRLLKESI